MSIEENTPFKKLMLGLIFGNVGYYIASIVPAALLLTIKFLQLDMETATSNFGFTTAVGGIATLIAGYAGGVISDRTKSKFGKRRTWIIAGALISSVGLVIIGYVSEVVIIAGAWLVSCIGFSFMNSALNGALADQCESEKRGTAGGIIGIFAPISIQIGVAIMTLINNTSISTKFNVLSGIILITSIVCCGMINDCPAENTETLSDQRKSNSSLYPSIKRYPEFSWTVVTRFFMAMAYASQTYMSLYFAIQFNIPESELSQLVLINGIIGAVAGAVSSVISGMISDKIKKQKPILILSALLASIGLATLAFADTILIVIAASVFINIGYSAYLGVNMALTIRILPDKKDAAKDMSIVNTAGNLPNSIVPACASSIIGIGGYALLFLGLSICGIISAASVIPIPEINHESIRGDMDMVETR